MVSSRFRLVFSVVLVFSVIIAGAAAAADRSVTCPVGGFPLVSCPVVVDGVVAQTIRSRFAGLFAPPFQQIDVSVIGGAVVLSGWVQSQAQKDTAGILASSVRGVARVENRLGIASPRTSDLAIARDVTSAIGKQLYNVQQVRVAVKNGIVTLSGFVQDDYVRSMVGLTAEGVPGVAAVQNGIAVSQVSWTY